MDTEITTKDWREKMEVIEEAEGTGNANEENGEQGADDEVDEEEEGGEEEEGLLVNPGAAVWASCALLVTDSQAHACVLHRRCPLQKPPRLKPPSANQFTYPQANTEASLHSPWARPSFLLMHDNKQNDVCKGVITFDLAAEFAETWDCAAFCNSPTSLFPVHLFLWPKWQQRICNICRDHQDAEAQLAPKQNTEWPGYAVATWATLFQKNHAIECKPS